MASPTQTVVGKSISNPLIVKGLLKILRDLIPPSCHAPLAKIRRNKVAMRVGNVYTRGKYPTYTPKPKVTLKSYNSNP